VSLDIARSIAVSSLMASQVQISVASSNVSNADTTGYTVKTAAQVSTTSGGVGTGVAITGITSNVDKLLFRSLITAASELGAADVSNNYLDRLQALYGSTTGADDTGTSIANTLASLEAAVSSLAATTSSASLQSSVVSALDDLASQLRETSNGIQDLRSTADAAISSDVDQVNDNLKTIASLNAQIKQAAAAGQPTGDLEDQRNVALQNVATIMNVSYFISSTGDMQVYTASGQTLVDSSAHLLSFTAASSVTATSAYDPNSSSGLSGISVNGVDITSQITSGEIGALINLRDTVLPAAQSQLDQLANELADSLNGASNQGTSLPPPSTLTGTTTVSSSTALNATGTVRVAVADQSGSLVSHGDLDLSNYSTVGDLVSAINGVSGLSASINASGKVVITSSSSSNGISINDKLARRQRHRPLGLSRPERSRHRDRCIEFCRTQRHPGQFRAPAGLHSRFIGNFDNGRQGIDGGLHQRGRRHLRDAYGFTHFQCIRRTRVVHRLVRGLCSRDHLERRLKGDLGCDHLHFENDDPIDLRQRDVIAIRRQSRRRDRQDQHVAEPIFSCVAVDSGH